MIGKFADEANPQENLVALITRYVVDADHKGSRVSDEIQSGKWDSFWEVKQR